jgi:hypothetical protein
MRLVAALLAVALWMSSSAIVEAAEKRVALVLGNGAYQNADVLANPVNDVAQLQPGTTPGGNRWFIAAD